MRTRLEELRILKERIGGESMSPRRRAGRLFVNESSNDEDGGGRDMVGCSSFRKTTKRRDSSKRRRTFKEWFVDVADMVEEITGMELDILPDLPWGSMFRDDMTVDEAVQNALRMAEEGDDNEGDDLSFRDWLKAVDHGLLAAGKRSIDERRRSGDITHSKIHMLYMEHRVPDDAIKAILGVRSPKRSEVDASDRGWAKRMDSDGGSRLAELMAKLNMSSGKKRVGKLEDVGDPTQMDDVQPVYRENSMGASGRGDAIENILGISPLREPDVDMEIMSSAMEGVAADVGKKQVSEASVLGGDFGRWGSATDAAAAVGPAIAKRLSKEGIAYKFSPEGMPQSGKGGTTLWFNFAPNQKDADNYWIGFQISGGDKNDPTWNVRMKKGKGLGSASTIASKVSLKTDGLKSAAASIKGSLG